MVATQSKLHVYGITGCLFIFLFLDRHVRKCSLVNCKSF